MSSILLENVSSYSVEEGHLFGYSDKYDIEIPCDDNSTNSSCSGIIPFCKQMLLEEIGGKSVRFWDVAVLVPNAIFLCFLAWKASRIREKLMTTNSPVFTAFYILVYLATIANVLRCTVSMAISASDADGEIIDKALWLVLECCLLTAELSVLAFGLFFGHLDSRTSMRRVLMVTTCISIIYTAVEAALEYTLPDRHYISNTKRFVLFSHGGMIYWMISSALLSLGYIIICVLPRTPIRDRLRLPAKRRFYAYCGFLAFLYGLQFLGATLIYSEDLSGMCVVTVSWYLKLAGFTPIVYFAFLRGYVTSAHPTLMFEYRRQKDDASGAGGELPDGNYYPGFPGVTGGSNYYDELLYNPTDPFSNSTNLNSPVGTFSHALPPDLSFNGSLVLGDSNDTNDITPAITRTRDRNVTPDII